MFSQQRKLFSELGRGREGATPVPAPISLTRYNPVLYFIHATGILPSAQSWPLPSTHTLSGLKFLVYLFVSVLNPGIADS